MLELAFILFEYLFLLYVTYHYSKKVLVAPSFSFVLCFIPQMILLMFYVDKWSVDLSDGTFLIFVFGPILFWFGTIIVEWFYSMAAKKSASQQIQKSGKFQITSINNTPNFMMFFLLFQIGVSLLTILYLVRNVTGYSLSNIILTYRIAAMAGESEIILPGILESARTLCYALHFYFVYCFANNIVNNKKEHTVLMSVILALGSFDSLLSGARGGVIRLIIAFLLQLYLAKLNKNHWQLTIDIKKIFKYMVVCVLGFQLFMTSADLLGREVTDRYTGTDYLAIYLAAQVKNLDSFVKEGKFGSDISNNQTFRFLINKFAPYMPHSHYLPDTSNWQSTLDIPFRRVNGYGLGNVYTVYYAPLYDYGYIGVIIYILFMGMFCEYVYINAKREIVTGCGFVNTIVYSYVHFMIIFSFFSSKFSENTFNLTFVKFIIVWQFMSWFHQSKFNKIRIKI